MISVIIPTLNEAAHLPATLQHIRRNPVSHEILVVDAGSVDGTPALAASAGCRVLTSPVRQRASQMNLGAREAGGDIFLFLHADTWVGAGALDQIEQAVHGGRAVGGAFARKFDGASWFLDFTCRLAELRSRRLGWFLGDQGIFVGRRVFEDLGGYRDMPLFEDLDFSRRLARHAHVLTLRPPVIASARRFAQRGAFATTWTDFLLTARYLCGVDPNRLAARLRKTADSPSGEVRIPAVPK
jgi:rSAM/selenodomain-associated transferase 2